MMERERERQVGRGESERRGWSCGVNNTVAIKESEMDRGNKKEERRRSESGQTLEMMYSQIHAVKAWKLNFFYVSC